MKFKAPQEVWTGKLGSYQHIRVFGLIAYAHVNDKKLQPRAKKCLFLGYPTEVKGYKLQCPNLKKAIINRDVTFKEDELLVFDYYQKVLFCRPNNNGFKHL